MILKKISKMSLTECIENYGLNSIIFTCVINGEKGSIIENRNYILSIYEKLKTYHAKRIDFNVIVVNENNDEIDFIISTLRDSYTGNWYNLNSVAEYFSEVNPELENEELFYSMIKEN